MRVAILGTGKMGNAVVQACTTKGFDLIAWNRTLSKALPLREKGGQVAERAADAISAADVVVSNVLSGGALLYALSEEPARRALAGKALIAMTTTSAVEAKRLEALVLEAGASAFLDVATISWPQEIAAGRGKVFVGCSTDHFAAWESFLGNFGTVERVGEVGSASAIEMAFFIQMVLHQYAYLSSCALLERHALPNSVFDRVMNNNSLFSSPLIGMYSPSVRARTYEPALYPLARYRRGLDLVTEEILAAGMKAPVLAEIVKATDEAIAAYGPNADWTSIYERLR